MPVALGSMRTGSPDAAAGIKLAQLDTREDSTVKLNLGIPCTDHIANTPTAHRASVPADSATDMSSAGFGTGTAVVNNRGSIAIWVGFETAGATCLLTVVFYDDAGTPAPMALSEQLAFAASAKRLSAAGNFMSEAKLVDSRGYKRFKVFVDSISAGDIDVFAEPV